LTGAWASAELPRRACDAIRVGKPTDVAFPNARNDSPYAVLGLHPSADPHAIRRTYRRIMRELHPDVSDDPQASELAARVTAAYEVLGNPDRRREFDSNPANVLKGWSDQSLWRRRWCPQCGSDIHGTATVGRSPTAHRRHDARYCTDACRQAAYRARRNTNEQLAPGRTDPEEPRAAARTEVRTLSLLKGLIRVDLSIGKPGVTRHDPPG
jgi:hypothetical protein